MKPVDSPHSETGCTHLLSARVVGAQEWWCIGGRMIVVSKGIIRRSRNSVFATQSGQDINVSSVYGHIVVATGTVYCATKHAVRAISEGLRQEVKGYNIRVTTISPGAVQTELTSHITEPGLAEAVTEVVNDIGVPAGTMSRMVAFAIAQPDDVDVSEILFRPTVQQQ